MSFRLFIYYSALIGGWAAFFGWMFARAMPAGGEILQASLYGLFLGVTVALGLSLVDALWNFRPSQVGPIAARVGFALFIGLFGGFLAGLVTGTLFFYTQWTIVFLFSWVLLGLIAGVSVGAFDLLAGLLTKNVAAGFKKLLKCAVGGTLGGIVGGTLAWLLRFPVGSLLGDPTGNNFWGPTAIGFVALGLAIGLLVGLSQVLLKEAWVKVEAGFRPGREMLLTKEKTVIGRAEGVDIALFGDNAVEKQHATIVQEKGRYYLEAAVTPAGTFVNDQQVVGRALLKSGDLIRVGSKSLLRFNERQKQK